MQEEQRLANPVGEIYDTALDPSLGAEILDGVRAGLFAVAADARIVHANAAGRVLLDSRDLLQSVNGRLAAVGAEADEMLREAITAAGNGDAAVGVKGIAVALTAGTGERHVAHLLPLTSGQRRRSGMGYAAVATVFVHR